MRTVTQSTILVKKMARSKYCANCGNAIADEMKMLELKRGPQSIYFHEDSTGCYEAMELYNYKTPMYIRRVVRG
jgi:hypothetical protein